MSHHNGFQIISDSAGCAFVRENGTIVTVRHLRGFLCSGEPLSDFLQNVAERMTESHETAMPNVPVLEMAWFGD